MEKSIFFQHRYAVSEVIGGMLLVFIAVVVFAAIYAFVFPLPIPSEESNVHLAGFVTYDGTVIIEHVGGEALTSYEVYIDGELEYKNNGNSWEIGERYIPSIENLMNPDDEVRVAVYSTQSDGSKVIVFDGVLNGPYRTQTTTPPTGPSMAITSLLTKTIDEDLICYTKSIEPNIPPLTYNLTYIFNWTVNNYPLARLLYPFDTNSPFNVKDYSGRGYQGTLYGPIWTSNGKIGGAYSFTGDDYIALPYCFDASTINKITAEAWVNTSQSSGTIISYDRSKYFELAITNGHVKWSTKTNDGIKDVLGSQLVNNNIWHYVATTYNSETGDAAIYIDGRLDASTHVHTTGEVIGTGTSPSGAIGKGTGVANRQTIFFRGFESLDEKNEWNEQNSTGGQQEVWLNLKYDNFNAGWGSYTDGDGSGSDCYRTNTIKHEGTYSARLRDNSGTSSSFYLTNAIDVDTPAYKSLKIDFWWMWDGTGWSNGEDWWVQYYNGTTWNTVLDTNYPSGFTKGVWRHKIVYINESNYRFPTTMKIRFQCDASDDSDTVYFDQVYINASTYGRIECDFQLLPSTTMLPHTESYSLGGSGDFEPEYALYNHTGIDIANYTAVKISVWYSYKNTISTDFLGLYYLNNSIWTPIFEVNNPLIGAGQQSVWTHVEMQLPSSLHKVFLQFKWRTSSIAEYVAIDDLEITGIHPEGEANFTGFIDEIKIYQRILTAEQIYQSYLCTKNGITDNSVIVSEETVYGDTWQCYVIPNDSVQDDIVFGSESLQIGMYSGGE